ncbi:MAG: hypothetical protein O6952_03325 [Planctomycetota bacterium]|nr:hypothetical protein [Planctomycetota bacterium]MCZ6691853.1 hypothetical protein [Planctomycetota bacterium]
MQRIALALSVIFLGCAVPQSRPPTGEVAGSAPAVAEGRDLIVHLAVGGIT